MYDENDWGPCVPENAKDSSKPQTTSCVFCEEDFGDDQAALFSLALEEKVGPMTIEERPKQVESFAKQLITYNAEPNQPVIGPPLRTGEVWHLYCKSNCRLVNAKLSLHANGLLVEGGTGYTMHVTWSPFSRIQACRFHSPTLDAERPLTKLFKVSNYQNGFAHVFALDCLDADTERVRWIADIACSLRTFTRSLFPPEALLTVDPMDGLMWTSTRLLSGHLLMQRGKDSLDIFLVYCELHCHWNHVGVFVVYANESCETRLSYIRLVTSTPVRDTIGVDCSCFVIDSTHFAARSAVEKKIWLRAIRNVQVKVQLLSANPSSRDLHDYRDSIREFIKSENVEDGAGFTHKPMLPRSCSRISTLLASRTPQGPSWHDHRDEVDPSIDEMPEHHSSLRERSLKGRFSEMGVSKPGLAVVDEALQQIVQEESPVLGPLVLASSPMMSADSPFIMKTPRPETAKPMARTASFKESPSENVYSQFLLKGKDIVATSKVPMLPDETAAPAIRPLPRPPKEDETAAPAIRPLPRPPKEGPPLSRTSLGKQPSLSQSVLPDALGNSGAHEKKLLFEMPSESTAHRRHELHTVLPFDINPPEFAHIIPLPRRKDGLPSPTTANEDTSLVQSKNSATIIRCMTC